MRSLSKIGLTLSFSILFISAKAQHDSVVHYQRDSVIEIEADCTTSFFERSERVESMGKTFLTLKNGKTVTMLSFFKTYAMGMAAQHGVTDLDGDGKKELVIYDFSGGAHCCDEIFIFRNTGPSKYQQVAKLFAGNTCITGDNDFVFDFYESFGYFFTCYACSYEDTAETAPVHVDHVKFRYSKNKLMIVPPEKEFRSQINDNLSKLGEQPYKALEDDMAQDNGQRKEFAMNLAVYYYSYGKNMVETQKLFNKYYRFPDAKKVWAAFVKQIQNINKQNIF